MIPNEVNEENSRNNFVQIRLGELCEQKEVIISDVVEQHKRKTQDLADLDTETSQILEKYGKHLNLNYRKKTTIQNYFYHVRKFLHLKIISSSFQMEPTKARCQNHLEDSLIE